MRFKVGDLVIGNSLACCYEITKEGWIGTVTEVEVEGFSAIGESIAHGKPYTFSGLDYDCFDLYYRPNYRPYEIQSDFGLRVDTASPSLDFIKGVMVPSIKFSPVIDEYKPQDDIEKIIFNKPATIVFAKGNKYKVKASLGEKFDKEKGLALALLKMFGISYPDLKRMIKSADDQDAKKKKNK